MQFQNKQNKEEEYQWKLQQIKLADEKGITIFIEGRLPIDQNEVCLVMEDINYMCDYEADEKGEIIKMSFHWIS